MTVEVDYKELYIAGVTQLNNIQSNIELRQAKLYSEMVEFNKKINEAITFGLKNLGFEFVSFEALIKFTQDRCVIYSNNASGYNKVCLKAENANDYEVKVCDWITPNYTPINKMN